MVSRGLGQRAIFALSSGLPNIAFAMLDEPPGMASPAPHVNEMGSP